MAGVVVGSHGLVSAVRDMQAMLGGIADPHSAYLLLRGVKTLGIRIRQQNDNGMAVARFLEGHPRVRRVYYPGLSSHPDYKIACEQMKGFGGVVSFEIDGDLPTASTFIDRLQIPYIAPSLGGVETLIEQPALMSYYEMTSEERAAIGISDELIRLSLGVEDADDLIADLAQALGGL
jgi:cystathionine gamma-synthase